MIALLFLTLIAVSASQPVQPDPLETEVKQNEPNAPGKDKENVPIPAPPQLPDFNIVLIKKFKVLESEDFDDIKAKAEDISHDKEKEEHVKESDKVDQNKFEKEDKDKDADAKDPSESTESNNIFGYIIQFFNPYAVYDKVSSYLPSLSQVSLPSFPGLQWLYDFRDYFSKQKLQPVVFLRSID